MINRVLISNVTVIDGLGNEPMRGANVIVDGRNIRTIFRGESANNKLNNFVVTKHIDGSGKYLLPGLIDMQIFPHAYALKGPVNTKLWHRSNSNVMKLLHGVKNLGFLLDSGYTTIRAFGMPDSFDIHLREAVRLGLIQGPQMLCSGQHLSPTGGHAEEMYGSPFGLREYGQTVDGITECVKAVRRRKQEGADFIMIHSGGGIMGKDEMYWRNFHQEEIDTIVKEAHAFDMIASAHVGSGVSVKTALDGGVDIVEQGYELSDDNIQQMKAQGTYYVPTMAVTHACAANAEKTGISQESLKKGRHGWGTHQDSVIRAYRAGVKMASGSNCFNLIRIESAKTEFPILASIGIPPLEIIKMATSFSADALRIGGNTGRIEEGKSADMILLTTNPLMDITVLGDPSRTEMVFKEGKLIKESIPINLNQL